MIWEIIPKIGTPIALIAFVAALVFYYLRSQLKHKLDLIKSAPATERADLIEGTLGDFSIDADELTRQQKYELLKQKLEHRAHRFRLALNVSLVLSLSVLMAFVVLPEFVKGTSVLGEAAINQESRAMPAKDEQASPGSEATETPVISTELIAIFHTGGDDLRGGNDNVHLILLMRSGAAVRFDNINNRNRWSDNSTQTISRPLPAVSSIDDIVGVRLETTFGGGFGGDNWNLDGLSIKARTNGTDRQLLNRNGGPLFRFTGDQRVWEITF